LILTRINMKHWLSRHVYLLTLAPVVVLIIFISKDVVRVYQSLEQANQTIAVARLVTATSHLVHELQKERGMSAGFIGSKGTEFTSQIINQRLLTDIEIKKLKIFMIDNSYNKKTNKAVEQLFSSLGQLQTIRKQIDFLDIDLPKALRYYTKNNLIILDLNGYLASELEGSNSSSRFLTLYNIAYAKEQAGIERAVLSNVFANGAFTPALFTQYIKLVTKQNAYLKSTFVVATTEFKKVLRQLLQSKENREVQRYRDIAKNSKNEFNVLAKDWFSAATARINKLKKTEQTLLEETALYSQKTVSSRRFIIMSESMILILIIAIACAVFSTLKLRVSQ
jgi:hypothetical protein